MNPISAILGVFLKGITKSIEKKPQKYVKLIKKAVGVFKFGLKIKRGFGRTGDLIKKITGRITKAEYEDLKLSRDEEKEKWDGYHEFLKKHEDNKTALNIVSYAGELANAYLEGGAMGVLGKVGELFTAPTPEPIVSQPVGKPNLPSIDDISISSDGLTNVYSSTEKGVADIVDIAKGIEDPNLSNAMITLAKTTARGLQSVAMSSQSNIEQLARGTTNIGHSLSGAISSSIDNNIANSSIIMENQDKSLNALNEFAPAVFDSANLLAGVEPIIQDIPTAIHQDATVTLNALDKVYQAVSNDILTMNDTTIGPMANQLLTDIPKMIVGALGNIQASFNERLEKPLEEVNENSKQTKAGFLDYIKAAGETVKSKVDLAREQYEFFKDSAGEIAHNVGFAIGAVMELFQRLPIFQAIKSFINKIKAKFGLTAKDGGIDAEAMDENKLSELEHKANSENSSYHDKVQARGEITRMKRANINHQMQELEKMAEGGDWRKLEGEDKRRYEALETKQKSYKKLIDYNIISKIFIIRFAYRLVDDSIDTHFVDEECENNILGYYWSRYIDVVKRMDNPWASKIASYQSLHQLVDDYIDRTSEVKDYRINDLLTSNSDTIIKLDISKAFSKCPTLLGYFRDNGVTDTDRKAITGFVVQSRDRLDVKRGGK